MDNSLGLVKAQTPVSFLVAEKAKGLQALSYLASLNTESKLFQLSLCGFLSLKAYGPIHDGQTPQGTLQVDAGTVALVQVHTGLKRVSFKTKRRTKPISDS